YILLQRALFIFVTCCLEFFLERCYLLYRGTDIDLPGVVIRATTLTCRSETRTQSAYSLFVLGRFEEERAYAIE
ncbi:hypothetical protein EDC04DRAFT_2730544, partial [Pisolithus marmoratus]